MSIRIRFENVGRFRKTWEAEYPFPANIDSRCQLFGRSPLFMMVCDRAWWRKQLRGVLVGEPEWEYVEEDDRVDIVSGWRTVGTARVVQEGDGK